MSFKPFPYQEDGQRLIHEKLKKVQSVLYTMPPGGGKCHSKDTPIMMYDQTIKMVQDVKVGDLLMGDDLKPRKVLSLARGQEMLYKVWQRHGIDYVVNESHILSLKHYDTKEVYNIKVLDYIKHANRNKLKGYNANHECLTDINITRLEVGDYYGFEIDGNHLYCLGDFTVTHNTALFCMIAKDYTEQKKKTLILCDSIDLVDQTIESLIRMGVTSEKVIDKTKKLHHKSDVYVAMVETAYNRLSVNPDFFKDVDLIIADEVHVLVYHKVYAFFPHVKILGMTATPCVQQRITYYKCDVCRAEYSEEGECHGRETMEWSKPFAMSLLYDDVIVGPSIGELIEMERLVKEISIIEKFINEDDLKLNSDGEFTTASQDAAYNKKEVMFNVVSNYEKYCLGKKTMIFTASTKANKMLLDEFIEAGHDPEKFRTYDSKNNKTKERKEIVEWFRNSKDGVLINTGCFTKGFDDTTVQAIIMNRSTMSLSLFMQIVGRGGRASKLIYKDSFIFIDGGGNIERHLPWSDNSRDWERIFWDGIGEDRPKKMQLDSVVECKECTMLYAASQKICPECGFQEPKQIKEKQEVDAIESQTGLLDASNIPVPNGRKIYKYVVSQNQNINFAFKILISQIVDLFRLHDISQDRFIWALENGQVDNRIEKYIRDCYHFLSRQRDIIPENWQGRKITTLIEMVKEKLKKYYNLD